MAENPTVANLRVDYIDRPLGLESARPCFSWTIKDSAQGVKQAAWRTQADDAEAALGEGPWPWDSGRPFDGPVRGEGGALTTEVGSGTYRLEVAP